MDAIALGVNHLDVHHCLDQCRVTIVTRCFLTCDVLCVCAINILQQYLGKDKYTVTNILVGIIEIADIIHTDIAFDIFKGINAFKNVLNVSCCIFMFFYDDSHN